jgi:hypothetical protein
MATLTQPVLVVSCAWQDFCPSFPVPNFNGVLFFLAADGGFVSGRFSS